MASKRYTAGISDGMWFDAGGKTTIEASTLESAKRKTERWADTGDYPCAPPVVVTLVLLDAKGEAVARWQHHVPDTVCSGKEDE